MKIVGIESYRDVSDPNRETIGGIDVIDLNQLVRQGDVGRFQIWVSIYWFYLVSFIDKVFKHALYEDHEDNEVLDNHLVVGILYHGTLTLPSSSLSAFWFKFSRHNSWRLQRSCSKILTSPL